ncbi:MAG: VTT domain-containing protein [Candidatus Nezhaarchaeota archaeon]|nr:VTT domain-containing protein [Candidatus Nezhaarchaeota archaeon]
MRTSCFSLSEEAVSSAEELIYSLIMNYGYLGAFLSALLSHLVPFIALPYLAVVWLLASTMPGLNPWMIGVLSGLGAGLGKASSYLIGRGGASIVGEERKRQLEALRGLLKDYAGLAALLASATPIPDDVVLIPVGMVRYSLWKYLAATVIGKVFLCTTVSLFASKFGEALRWLIGVEGGWVGVAASVAIMLLFSAFILRVDWLAVAEEVSRSGWRGFADRVRREGLGFLFTKRPRPP